MTAVLVLTGTALTSCADDTGPDADGSAVDVRDLEVSTIRAEEFCDDPVDPDAAAAPTVVFLHGASYRASTWVDTGSLAAMCAAGIPAVAVDLPGFGDTPDTDLGNIEFMDALIDVIGTDVVVVSPSMSGGFSLPWLETSPPAAVGFVPVAPVGIDAFSPPDDLDVPTLVLWGGDDRVVDVAGADTLVERIPGAEVMIVEGGDHAVYESNPEAFNEALTEFVESLV